MFTLPPNQIKNKFSFVNFCYLILSLLTKSYGKIQPILWKTGHTKGRSLIRDGGLKKGEIKKVNMVDILPIEEWIYTFFKPVEITVRRRPRQKGEK
jgi:hypothetical protein